MCSLILGLVIILILTYINNKTKSELIKNIVKSIIKVLVILFFILITILMVIIFFSILLATLIIVYSLFVWILSLFLNKELAKFLALFMALVAGIYFPDRLGFLILKLLVRIGAKGSQIHTLYPSFVKALRLKIWAYLIAFILTMISSCETINGKILITNSKWLEIKPYILEAVVSFIAFDTLIKYLSDENIKILSGLKSLWNRIYKDFNEAFTEK